MNRREARRLGRVAGAGINKLGEWADEAGAKRLAEAQAGESDLTRAHRESAAKLRRQADDFGAKAAEAEAAGKTSKAARLRKVQARANGQADEWLRKAEAEGAKLKAWADEQDA